MHVVTATVSISQFVPLRFKNGGKANCSACRSICFFFNTYIKKQLVPEKGNQLLIKDIVLIVKDVYGGINVFRDMRNLGRVL